MSLHRPLPLQLPPLSSAQWRCLRVVGEVGDLAHAARKLHWSQALLKATLADLQACVGAQHLALLGERVQLSQALQEGVRLRPPCRSENASGDAGAETLSSQTAPVPVPPAPAVSAR